MGRRAGYQIGMRGEVRVKALGEWRQALNTGGLKKAAVPAR